MTKRGLKRRDLILMNVVVMVLTAFGILPFHDSNAEEKADSASLTDESHADCESTSVGIAQGSLTRSGFERGARIFLVLE